MYDSSVDDGWYIWEHPQRNEKGAACFQLIEKLIKNKINGDRVVCYFICTYFIVVDFWVGETDVFIDG